jgi:hypothetical protein
MAVGTTNPGGVRRVDGSEKLVVTSPKGLINPDDVLTPSEGALLKKAEREMKQGKFVTLDQLHHDLARKRPSGRRKTA